jgi:hypothetical protein
MATTKKHIAVYLDPAVQQALSDFCEQRGLKSKKGVVFSAGVNTALAEFFGLVDTEEGSTPIQSGNIPIEYSDIPIEYSDIPANTTSNTLVKVIGSIPVESLVVEVLPGKLKA